MIDRPAWSRAAAPGGGLRLALVALLGLLIAALWTGLAFHLRQERALRLDQARAMLLSVTQLYGEQIMGRLRGIEQMLQMAGVAYEQGLPLPDARFLLGNGVLPAGAHAEIVIHDIAGRPVWPNGRADDAREADFFKAHRDAPGGAMRVGVPVVSPGSETPVIELSRRLSAPGGALVGVAVIRFDPSFLLPVLPTIGERRPIGMGVIGDDAVYRAKSGVLPPTFGRVGERFRGVRLMALAAERPSGDAFYPSPVDGVWRLIAWSRLEGYGAFVAASIAEGDALAGFDENARALALATGAVSLLFLAAGLLLARALGQRAALAADMARQRAELLEAQRLGRLGHFTVDDATATVVGSAELHDLLGQPPRSVWTSAEAQALIHPDDQAAYRDVRARGEGSVEIRLLRPDGEPCWVSVQLRPHRDAGGRRVGLFGIVQDVTERKLAEATMREQARQLRAIMDNAPFAIFLKDRERRYIKVNRQLEIWAGRAAADIVGRTDAEISDRFEQCARPGDRLVLEEGRVSREERPEAAAHHAMQHVVVIKFPIPGDDGAVIGLAGFMIDVTERRRLDDQLRQSAKMEAVGRLAGSLAHDINNMVGAIDGFAQFLVEDLDPAQPQHGFATRIVQVCANARALVQRVLAFARAESVVREPLDLGAVLEEQVPLVAAALPAGVGIDVVRGAGALPVLANRAQLHQVLMNLCVNAADALGGRGGRIRVEAGLLAPGDPDAGPYADDADAGRVTGGRFDPETHYAVLRVRDTGTGMDQATLDRIFEPFFTTKPKERGTGLGLAVIHGIVAGQGGAYRVLSRPGEGAEFSIYLPFYDEAASLPSGASSVTNVRIEASRV